MGQRLLLAISLLIAARIVTFISPLPAEPDASFFSRGEKSSMPQRVPPLEENSPLPPSAPDQVPAYSAPPPIEDATLPFQADDWGDRNDVNPVQGWESVPPPGVSDASPATPRQIPTNAIANVCEALKPAVVTVRAGREIGSGSIVSPNGLVITNHHVVRRLRDQPLSVTAQDGNRYTGRVIANDRRNDLALIQLQTRSPLPSLPVAMSSPTIGQPVCAIGSPFGQAGTVTVGQLVRILPNGDLQSDVELQPGNSGGPLINARGEMMGVNKGVARDRQMGMNDIPSEVASSRRVSYSTNALVADYFIQQNRRTAYSDSQALQE